MVFYMNFKVDGACRGNGRPGAYGGVGVALSTQYKTKGWHRAVDDSVYTVTNQRAELDALVFALEIAIKRRDRLDICTELHVTIESDSRYAVDCMTKWINNWRENGWTNSQGYEVSNKDLIKRVDKLWDEIIYADYGGQVIFKWIPRSQNQFADDLANDACNEQEE